MLYYIILLLLVCSCILFFSSKITRSICFLILSASVIFLNITFKQNNIFMLILQIIISILIIGIYIFIQKKITYDFTGKIMSFTYIFYSFIKPNIINGERIVGRVLPYNNYQLKYNGRYITTNEISAAGATLISGSIGSGKTYGMMSLIKQDIASKKSVIFAEYKGDPDVVNELVNFAKSHNFKTFKISFGKSDFNYDPLQNLNNVGRIEALMNMRKWSIDGSDAHYKTSVQLLLQKLVGDFSHKYQEVNGSYTLEFYQYVKAYHPNRDEWDAYSTTSKLLELLLTSSLEDMFKGRYQKTLNLKEIKNDKFLLVVSFVSSNKELATSFSSLMFKDLLDECTVESPKQNINLYIDEFGTLENPFIVKDILEKGRSGKIATSLALQDINQIVIQTNEAYLNSILGIINTFIIYSGATRTTAEKFAGVQLLEIESVLMNLRKPINGQGPTAIYISKYPTLNKKINSEVFRFEPYIYKEKQNTLLNKNQNEYKTKNIYKNNILEKQDEIKNTSDLNSIKNIEKEIQYNNKEFKKVEDVYNDFI